ncbi:MAG: DUF6089 family protein [Bacteroidia bacterium]|nr:DUF6089 family protein [Bacteroidia bacterium]
MKIPFTVLLLYVLIFPSAIAQRTHSFSAGIGTIYYYGDLTDRFNNSLLRPAFNVSYSRYIIPGVSFRVGLSGGEIGASDGMAIEYTRQVRNLHFRSPIYEASGCLVYEILQDKDFGTYVGKPHISPYVFAGVAFFRFNPKARYNGVWYDLRDLGTEGQFIPGHTPGPYALTQAAVPFGIGVNIRLASYTGLNMEVGYRTTMTDYLDDVSTVYPDFEQLAEVNGSLATELSERSPDNRFKPGEIRGNPNANDGYFFTAISVVYYLSRFATRD